MSNERFEILAAYLAADVDRANALLQLDADVATEKINADGFDFTVEEVKDFGIQMQKISAYMADGSELTEDTLDDVAGGVVITAAVLAAGVTLFTAGVTAGYKVARDRGW